MSGDIDTIKKAVINCINMGDEKTIISAGCEVPANTPEENLLAVNQMLIELGSKEKNVLESVQNTQTEGW